MAVQEPFVRWLYVKHPPKFCRTGGFFYVETGRGDRIIVAAAVDNGANHLYFRASSTFVAYYRGILPLGNVIRWDFRKDVVAWLDSVVYYSFVRYSSQHIGRCWYVLEACGPEFTGPTRMPLGLAHVFQGQGGGKWILLKHGNKICPNACRPVLCLQMATNDPFVRIYFEDHDPELHIEGGLFYLHTSSNQSHLAAISTGMEPTNLTYEASPDFVAKYSEEYPIGHTLVWDNKDSFYAWLDSLIYYSFLLSNDQGVNRPWFVKEIPAPNPYQLTGVPIGFERNFNEEYDTFWILLKSGNRVWPVRIINNNFRDNWSSFLKDHGVGPNFKIVFGCYKKWIFDVYVLNTSLERVMQRWNIGGNFLEQLVPENYITETSCVPYTMLTEFRYKQFGCMCMSKDQIKQVFEQNLNQLLRDGELKKLVLKTGPREWHIPLRHSSIRYRNFVKFLYEHSLREGDFIFVGVSQVGVLQIIVFARDGGERMRNWYH